MREVFARILLLYQCWKTFQHNWYQFYKDAIAERNNQNVLQEIHCVGYRNHKLYYRTGTKDVILIVCILIKKILYNYDIALSNECCVLDLGANIGLFSLKYATENPSLNVNFLAVEPEEENFRILQKNLSQIPNAIAVHAGVWWRNADLEIIDHGVGSWAFQVRESENGPIKALSIDSLLDNYKQTPSVVKMDIEGSEMTVFSHPESCKWLDTIQQLIIEIHEQMVPGVYDLVSKSMEERRFEKTRKGEDYFFYKN